MKICYLNHDLEINTGAGRFCLALIGAVRAINPSYRLKVLTSKDLLAGGFAGITFNFFKIRSIFREFDIIHALDGWPYGVIAALTLAIPKIRIHSNHSNENLDILNCLTRPKLIITAIGTGAVQPLYNPIKKWLMIWAYKKADRVTAISNNTRREILKVIPNLAAEVINHGVDTDKFKVDSLKLTVRPEILNLKPYILSVGALKKRKGYEYSIRAFAEIAPKFPELKYVIVGEGPEKPNLESRIKNLELSDRIKFFDCVEENFLVSLYQNAELFILLPQDDKKDIEGFGLVFLEAAAAGLPVISAKESSAEDAVLDGKNGILVSQKDSSRAAAAISKILSDENLKKSFSRESVNFARSMSWEKTAQKYITMYHNLK